jgi:hypothetical protein
MEAHSYFFKLVRRWGGTIDEALDGQYRRDIGADGLGDYFVPLIIALVLTHAGDLLDAWYLVVESVDPFDIGHDDLNEVEIGVRSFLAA